MMLKKCPVLIHHSTYPGLTLNSKCHCKNVILSRYCYCQTVIDVFAVKIASCIIRASFNICERLHNIVVKISIVLSGLCENTLHFHLSSSVCQGANAACRIVGEDRDKSTVVRPSNSIYLQGASNRLEAIIN